MRHSARGFGTCCATAQLIKKKPSKTNRDTYPYTREGQGQGPGGERTVWHEVDEDYAAEALPALERANQHRESAARADGSQSVENSMITASVPVLHRTLPDLTAVS